MGNRRHQDAATIYRVWDYTFQGRRLLQPDPTTNATIARLLRRWADVHDVEILGYLFLDDRYFLDIRCRTLTRAEFMRDFKRELAKAINREIGRTGSVFAGPYHDQAILDDDELYARQVELYCLPVELGLVTHPELWPGLSSLPDHPDHKTARASHPAVTVAVDAAWAGGHDVDALVADVEARRVELREAMGGPRCPKLAELTGGDPKARARRWRKCRPRCRASRPEKVALWYQRYHRRNARYGDAYARWLAGEVHLAFPEGMHPPSWHRVVQDRAVMRAS